MLFLGIRLGNSDLNKDYYIVKGNEFDEVHAFDNCGIVTKLVNEFDVNEFVAGSLSGHKFNIGENTVTWYAEDDSGNRSEAQFYVTVVDNDPPVLLTNALVTSVGNRADSCDAIVDYTPPVFIDYGTSAPLTNHC